MELTPQEILADLYDNDQDAHFDTAQLRCGLARDFTPAQLDEFISAVEAAGDPTIDLETATTLLNGILNS